MYLAALGWRGCAGPRPHAPDALAPRALRAPIPRLMQRLFRPQTALNALWPNAEFIEETKSAFPERGFASAEEARVLFSAAGYTYLDVRPEGEVEEAGRLRGSVHIPWEHARRVWSEAERRKVLVRGPNHEWVQQVARRFPDRDTPLLVGCSDGRRHAIDAMMALLEAGYTNIVGLRGGYTAWAQLWDHKLQRRRSPHGGATGAAALRQPGGEGEVRLEMQRLAAAERQRERGVRELEAEVKAAKASLERALERRLEGQVVQAETLVRTKDRELAQHKALLAELAETTTKLRAARARMAAAEAEVREREGDMAVLNREAAAILARRGRHGAYLP